MAVAENLIFKKEITYLNLPGHLKDINNLSYVLDF